MNSLKDFNDFITDPDSLFKIEQYEGRTIFSREETEFFDIIKRKRLNVSKTKHALILAIKTALKLQNKSKNDTKVSEY